MAAPLELPYEVQRPEARRRATAKANNGLSPMKYLTPNFLSRFPVVMEPKESEEHPAWNKAGVSRLSIRLPERTIIKDNLRVLILIYSVGFHSKIKRAESKPRNECRQTSEISLLSV